MLPTTYIHPNTYHNKDQEFHPTLMKHMEPLRDLDMKNKRLKIIQILGENVQFIS